MASLQGNQIAQGALGGNATGVAKGILAGQNARTMASTDAGLYSAGYGQALGAAQQQQQTGLAGANALANYGISGQNAALTGATAQVGAGSLEQQTAQQQLNALYGQYQQAQAYPYQQAQWLAGLQTGVGSNLGTSSSGTTTGPAPNQTAQYLGAGLSAAGLFLSDRRAKEDIEHIGKLNDGQKIYRYRYKGQPGIHIGLIAQEAEHHNPDSVQKGVGGMRFVDMKEATDDAVRRAAGGGVAGTPWADAQGWIPQLNIHGGSAPHAGSAPSLPQTPAFDASKILSGASGLGKASNGLDWGGALNAGLSGAGLSGDAWGGGSFKGGDAYGGSSSEPLFGLNPGDYGEGFARGGVVGYAGGGAPISDDGFNELDALGGFPEDYRRIAEDKIRARDGIVAPGTTPPDESMPVFGPDGRMMGNQTSAQGQPPAKEAPVVAEDDEAPGTGGVAGRTRYVPLGRVQAFAPEGAPGSYGGAPDAVTRPAAARPDGGGGVFGVGPLSPNASNGLLAGGLGMLASRSPFLGNAVGEGGIAGVNAYSSAEEHDRKVAAEAQKLADEARQQNLTNDLNERKFGETVHHNEASENAGSKLPPLYARDAKGNIILAPGAEAATRQLTNARRPEQGDPLNDDAVQMLADRVRAGDVKALVGLGRGTQGAADLRRIQTQVAADAKAGKPVNEAARSILENAAQQAGLVTAERTQAAIMSKLSVYGRTAFNATDIALEASKAVPRTQWQPVNKAFLAFKEKTGDPAVVALGQALTTLSNEYARAIGGGHGTVHDKDVAERRLSATQTPEQLEAVIKIMRKEVIAEERAMPAARQQIRDIYNPGAAGPRGSSIAGEHGVTPPPGPVTGASGAPGFQPPADAIARTSNGRIYYYDPKTLDAKGHPSPYPGQ